MFAKNNDKASLIRYLEINKNLVYDYDEVIIIKSAKWLLYTGLLKEIISIYVIFL